MGGPGPAWGSNPNAPPNIRGRQAPLWMDLDNRLGELLFLVMSPKEGFVLPKNPFVIQKSLTNHAGDIEPCSPLEKGSKLLLKTRNRAQFDKLQSLTKLINGTEVSITSHPYLNSVQCVIVCDSLDGLSDDEILSEMKEQKVISVKRFLRKEDGQLKPTNSFLLKVDSVVVPNEVRVGCLIVKTRTYYPRPMVCTNCLAIGHTKNRCTQPNNCSNCGELEHGECSSPAKCKNCSGSHASLNRSCPSYLDEQKIIKLKIDNGISHTQAKTLFEKRNTTSVNERLQIAQQDTNKDKIISELKKTVASLEKKMEELLHTTENLQKERDNLKKMIINTLKPQSNTPIISDNTDSSDIENTTTIKNITHSINHKQNLKSQTIDSNNDDENSTLTQKRKVTSSSSTEELFDNDKKATTKDDITDIASNRTTRKRSKNRKNN